PGAARQLDPVVVVDVPDRGELGGGDGHPLPANVVGEALEKPGAGAVFAMLGQQPQRRLVLGVIAEVRGADNGLGPTVPLQQRPERVPEAAGGQLSAPEQRDHLRFAAWPQPSHAQYLASVSAAVTCPSRQHLRHHAAPVGRAARLVLTPVDRHRQAGAVRFTARPRAGTGTWPRSTRTLAPAARGSRRWPAAGSARDAAAAAGPPPAG